MKEDMKDKHLAEDNDHESMNMMLSMKKMKINQ